MRLQLSRRHSLSLGIFGGLGVLGAWSCAGNVDSTGGAGTGGTGGGDTDGGSTGGSGGSGGSTGGSGGSGGSTGGSGGSGGSTGGSGGSGGSTGGSGGSGGSTGGSAGSGGSTGGSAGSGGSTGGSAGSGGSTGGSAGTGGSGGSKDAGSGGDGSNTGCGMAVAALISGNHGHTLSVPPADITAGVDKTYNARGTATHDHFVQVTAADFATLKAGGTVIKKSCNSNDHEFVLSCAPPTRQPTAPTCSDECGATMTTPCPP